MFGCDTFVVLPPLTRPGGLIFGKNSDRPSSEVQEVVYFPEKSGLTAKSKIKCTYIEVEEICEKVYAVALTKPTWMWGAEMGANSRGVAIGNEAIFVDTPEPSSEKRLLGMDLVRLGLERGGTAEGALSVVTQYLESYGQGGPCTPTEPPFYYHNSFLIADPTEAWVLETVDYHWAAQRLLSGFRNISNTLSISTNIDKMSNGLKEYAIENKLWNGKGEFNFKEVFASSPCQREAAGRRLLEKASSKGSFEVEDMFAILRNKDAGINMGLGSSGYSSTTASQVSLVTKEASVHWFTGTPDPSLSVFKPFIFTPAVDFPQDTVSQQGDDPHLYKLNASAVRGKPKVVDKLRQLESSFTTKMIEYVKNTGSLNPSEIDSLFKNVLQVEIGFYK